MKFIPKLLSLSIFLCLVTLPIIILANLYIYFHWSFGRFQVYDNFENQPPAELNQKFNQVLQYINIPFDTELDSGFFSPEDRLHMQDVRNLFIVVNVCFIGFASLSMTLFVMTKPDIRKLMKGASKLLIIYIVILIAIGIYLIFTWKSGFTLFHQLLFPNNSYWMLDPASSNLIKYLPEQIFQELALLYFIELCIEYLAFKLVPNLVEKR